MSIIVQSLRNVTLEDNNALKGRCRGELSALEIHHKDPQTAALVSGLTVPANLREDTVTLNAKLGNRFLPYRGAAPNEPGDMAYFLDPDTEEWVEAKWLGEWWTQKAKRYDSRCKPRKKGRVFSEEHRRRLSETAKKRGMNGNAHGKGWNPSPETRTRMSASAKNRKKIL